MNPRRSIGEIIRRPLDLHGIGEPAERREMAESTMEKVGLPNRLYHSYPSQISGGQRQRVAIARALIVQPELMICDEPTSALDVSVQSQILNLLLGLQKELGLTYLIITHDIGVVDYIANRVAVMYLGQIVEFGSKDQILKSPRHPYTRMLLESVLTLDSKAGLPKRSSGGARPKSNRHAEGVQVPSPLSPRDRRLCQRTAATPHGK